MAQESFHSAFAAGLDALLFSQEKGQLFFISSRRALAESLSYNTGACVKRDDSPATKQFRMAEDHRNHTFKPQQSCLQACSFLSKGNLQRVCFRAWAVTSQDESKEKGKGLPDTLGRAISDQLHPLGTVLSN